MNVMICIYLSLFVLELSVFSLSKGQRKLTFNQVSRTIPSILTLIIYPENNRTDYGVGFTIRERFHHLSFVSRDILEVLYCLLNSVPALDSLNPLFL